MNYVRKIIIGFIILVVILTGTRLICGPLIWQNLTDSGPHGIYIYATEQTLQRGDWCVVKLPQDVPGLHIQKGYKLIKQLRAFSGEDYDITGDNLVVHNRLFPITRADYLPQLPEGRYVVPTNHYLFLNDPALSFDSRYLGPLNADDVQCKVIFVLDYDKVNQYWLKMRSWFR